MKINNFYKITIVLIIAIYIQTSLQQCNALELNFATDDTPGNPYIIGGGKSFRKKPGIEVELYKIVARKLKISLNISRMPWSRCLHELKEGKLDAIFPTSYKKSRESFAMYPKQKNTLDSSKKSRDTNYALYKLKGSSILWDGKNMTNYNGSIGATKNWSIISDLKKLNLNLVEGKSPLIDLNKLVRRRISGAVSLESVFDAYIRNDPIKYKDIEKVYPPVKRKEYFLTFSRQAYKAHKELIEKFWETIKAIKSSNDYELLLIKYSQNDNS